jgi:Tfp pilus assembly PilM family ATPase
MSLMSFGRVRSAAMNSINGHPLPIAIDFGVSSLKVIQLAPSNEAGTDNPVGMGTSLIAAACLPTPENFLADAAKRFDFQFKALPRLIKSVAFKGKRATCAIPAAQMFCKHMQFPRAESIDLSELVRSAVSGALECAPDALVYRHVPVSGATPANAVTGMSTSSGMAPTSTGGAKQEVICLATSRHFVGQLMAAIREAKLEPVGMHPECFATVRAFEQLGRRESDKNVTTLYLDLAYGSTKVWIGHGTELIFAKTVFVGGRDLDMAVARSAECEIAQARAKRLNAAVLVAEPRRPAASPQGSPTPGGLAMLAAAMAKEGVNQTAALGAPVATEEDRRTANLAPGMTSDVATQSDAPVAPPEFDVREPLEMLTDEIAGCLRYHHSLFGGRRVDRVIFVGGEARHRGLCQHVARKLRVPAHVADPLARMARSGREPCHGVDFGAMQPGWTVAYGLGLCPTDL